MRISLWKASIALRADVAGFSWRRAGTIHNHCLIDPSLCTSAGSTDIDADAQQVLKDIVGYAHPVDGAGEGEGRGKEGGSGSGGVTGAPISSSVQLFIYTVRLKTTRRLKCDCSKAWKLVSVVRVIHQIDEGNSADLGPRLVAD